MKLLNKIKSLFRRKEEKLEEKEIIDSEASKPIPDPIKLEDRIQCGFCGEEIMSDDRRREIQGKIMHKRCFKKLKKSVLEGKPIS